MQRILAQLQLLPESTGKSKKSEKVGTKAKHVVVATLT